MKIKITLCYNYVPSTNFLVLFWATQLLLWYTCSGKINDYKCIYNIIQPFLAGIVREFVWSLAKKWMEALEKTRMYRKIIGSDCAPLLLEYAAPTSHSSDSPKDKKYHLGTLSPQDLLKLFWHQDIEQSTPYPPLFCKPVLKGGHRLRSGTVITLRMGCT